MENIEQQTLELLHKVNENNISISDMLKLIQVINDHDKKYYINDNPTIADAEYDKLFAALKKLELKYPEHLLPNSPTQRVAHGLNESFAAVNHLVPMLSLENSYNEADLLDWDRKCKELSATDHIEYCVEPKFDGASISLIFENNQLVRAATRGNGVQGDDITMNARQIRNIPLYAHLNELGIAQIEIRGEVLMSKKVFASYNQYLIENNTQPLANARNAASGSLRIKDPKEVAKRKLEAYLYHVSFVQTKENISTQNIFTAHSQTLQKLEELGFNTSYTHTKVCNHIHEVIEYVKQFEEKRDDLPYEIDGMVIKVNSLALQERIGQTSHHPRWAIAFKFKARQATSILQKVEFQVGRTGSITPVAKIAPVTVGGVTISSISLFNEDVIKEKNLMIGDTILVERAGDVIPYIVKSFPELRTGAESVIQYPTHCPVCNEETYKPEGEAVSRCINVNCEAQIVERIIHFASKDAMDIRGLGDALIRKFYALKFIHNITDIYHLPFDKIKTIEGFGEKSVQNLQLSIEKSKEQPLHKIIYALGIRYVGETTAKTLARSISHLSELQHKTYEQLIALEDVGEKVAASILAYFKHAHNQMLLAQLEKEGLQFENSLKSNNDDKALHGKTFLFTGTLSMKRSEAEKMVENKGGTLLNTVSSKLNYLVVGEDAGSKLEKAKKLNTIHILSEEEFLKMLNGTI